MMNDWNSVDHDQVRQAWDQNAAYWDEHMGEGNDWVETLSWPATERLLAIEPGERVLDAACGNGLTSRRLAARGAKVVAFDFSAEMIEIARRRSPELAVTYHVLNGADEPALLELGEGQFDAALCAMALFDMAEIDPLMRAVARLLRPGGRFVFSVLHPCFNNDYTTHLGEQIQVNGKLVNQYSVKVTGYLSPVATRGVALFGQPALQYYFHRPLQALFGSAFAAGLVLDGLAEAAFPPDHPVKKDPLSFGSTFSDIPPIMVARMRRPLGSA